MTRAYRYATHWGPDQGVPIRGWDGKVHRFRGWRDLAADVYCMSGPFDNSKAGTYGPLGLYPTVSFVREFAEETKCRWCWSACLRCGHGHTEKPWREEDPDDGTCWSAGSLVCGCPKKVTEIE